MASNTFLSAAASSFMHLSQKTDNKPSELASTVKLSEIRSVSFADSQEYIEYDEDGTETSRYHRQRPLSLTNESSSMSSIYLMLTDCRYYFQHPIFRVVIQFVVMFLNVVLYVQNPSSHSLHILNLPVIGELINMIFAKYPPRQFGLLKLSLWLVAVIIGYVIGKYFFHRYICNHCLRLKMFSKGQGIHFFIFTCVSILIYLFSMIYNEIIQQTNVSRTFLVTARLDMTYEIYSKLYTCGLFFGNFITMVLIADVIIYSKLYPNFCTRSRHLIRKHSNRVLIFWILFVIPITLFSIGIFLETEDKWDRLFIDQSFNDELWNLSLTVLALILNLLSVMQDWDFPHFKTGHDYSMPGLDSDHIKCFVPKQLRGIEIQGKAFNYAVIFFVIVLDIQGCISQFYYVPADYTQYADPDGIIYNIHDRYSLDNYENLTLLSYSYRSSHNDSRGRLYMEGDTELSARFTGYEYGTKSIILVPVAIVYIVFCIITYWFGTYDHPTAENKYTGRLFKVKATKQTLEQQRIRSLDIAMRSNFQI